MQTIVFVDRDDYKKVEEEEQNKFIFYVLESMGVPTDEWPEGFEFSVQDRINMRAVLNKYGVSIIDDRDGGIKIYVDKEVVAEWKKCTYNLREDKSELEHSKRLFYEMHIDCWSLFDEDVEEESDPDSDG